MTTAPDLFTWLRGLTRGTTVTVGLRRVSDTWPNGQAATVRRLWSSALDVIEAADRLSENAAAGILWPKVERLRDTLTAFYGAAEKGRVSR